MIEPTEMTVSSDENENGYSTSDGDFVPNPQGYLFLDLIQFAIDGSIITSLILLGQSVYGLIIQV